jgi:uncharacterized RDD family membrane protein YckC
MRHRIKRWKELLLRAENDHLWDRPDAERVPRIAATIVDVLLFTVIVSIFSKLLGAIELTISGTEDLSGLLFGGGRTVFFSIAVISYFVIPTCFVKGTPAKTIFGLRVLSRKGGGRTSMRQVLLRELVGKYGLGILSLGFVPLMYILGFRNRPFHDDWADTTVKRVHGRP